MREEMHPLGFSRAIRGDATVEEGLDKQESLFGLLRSARNPVIPVKATGSQVGTGRVGDHQIPRFLEEVGDIPLDVELAVVL